MFTIDKGVPLIAWANGPRGAYPWAQMEAGDSFHVPTNGDATEAEKIKARVASSARHFCRDKNLRAAMRTEVGGFRVWLVPRGEGLADRRRFNNPDRAVLMAERHLAGETLQSIGNDLGITRERVRQIVRKAGITVRESRRVLGFERAPWNCPECGKEMMLTPAKAKQRKTCGDHACKRKLAGQRKLWTRERIITVLQELATELGRTPSTTEMYARGCQLTLMAREFGSVRAAIEAAGLVPRKPGRRPNDHPTLDSAVGAL